MTWAINTTGDSKALIAAEYECPEHGRFEITVARDQVPDIERCRHAVLAIDLAFPGPPNAFACGTPSPWCFPAPLGRVQRVTAARRGKDPERPPGCVDWEALAYEEKSPEEWHAAERRKDWEDVRKIVKGALR